MPVLDRPFRVTTDASGYAIGAILSQICPETGKEYVVCYATRLLKETERFYSVSEREALAIIWALTMWREYLCRKFEVVTDAKAITFLLTNKSPNMRLCRWFITLQAFDFDIKYRKGTDNKCADLLSRPIRKSLNEKVEQIYTINSDIYGNNLPNIDEEDEDELNSRNLDAYDDDCLIHYLKFGRHIVGISQKQKRRVDKILNHYKIDANDDLWYRKNVNSDNWLMYSQKETRQDLILAAHNLGHFAGESTLKRLQESYFWKKMSIQVESTVKRCATCQRNTRVPTIHHPAIAIEADSIFSHVICDLSFGFPVTPEGFNGVLVIIDRLSKFPFVYPIKSKSAEEVSEKLLDFICLVSPFKSMCFQNDRGKEWLNKVVDNLLNAVGIDRRVSSAYTPQSQGTVEVFNKNLADAIRKCAETNTSNWHKFIPFVCLAFRTKVHESTKMTPYSLVFGKNPNLFINYQNKISSNDANELFNRSMEIKKLFEQTILKTKENLEKAQEHQKNSQIRRNNVSTERLALGTKIYVKAEGLLNKLANEYIGPWTIAGYASGGNYYLNNTLSERVSLSYPHQKLKVVDCSTEEDEINLEVEKILDAKIENDEQFFLVKWKNSKDEDWIPLSAFNSMEIISEFNKSKALESSENLENITKTADKEFLENRVNLHPYFPVFDSVSKFYNHH